MIKFGGMSVALLAAALQALVLAGALLLRSVNRAANRWLASLLFVMAGMLTPFVIGYAGFYDAWPWLSFAPFAVPLAVGPLFYGYARAIARADRIGPGHAIAPLLQFGWQSACFVQPITMKAWIDAAIQEPFLTPLTDVAVVLSMGGYAIAALQLTHDARGGAKRMTALHRLRLAAAALLTLVAARAGFDLYDAFVADLDYFDLFAFYLLLAIVATMLGIEGWRASAEPLPAPPEPSRDWRAVAQAWVDQLRAQSWQRDPELDLSGLARRLGTNTSYLSRALNEGLDTGFAELLSTLRAEGVAARLDAGDGGDLLALALDEGFGSKASFNRAFAKRFGMSPSAYRASRRKESALATS